MRKIIAVIFVLIFSCFGVVEADDTQREPIVYADGRFTIAIASDGTVRYVGEENYVSEDFQDNFKDRKDIVGFTFYPGLAGLTEEGKILYNGEENQAAYEEWGAFNKIATSSYYTVGLRKDGTAIAVSNIDKSKYVKFPWDNIVDIEFLLACPSSVICAILSDGSVGMAWIDVFSPYDIYFQEASNLFNDIVELDGQHEILVGLKKDGTVVVYDYFSESEVSIDWTDITDVAANSGMVAYGLKEDGTVVYYDCVSNESGMLEWNDIVSISAGNGHIVGVRKDGKILAAGINSYGQCNVNSWDLTPLTGDANDDNAVNAEDALAILKVAAQIDNFGTEFIPEQWSPENAKITSGSLEDINAKDALEVLKIAAKVE